MYDPTKAALDDRMRAALARLTENEKACLRRRLRPQTAKEMALELGVSPHAIEKRLKMARAKLGVSSSLEAARLLELAEAEYQRPGPEPSDLEASPATFHPAPDAGAQPSLAGRSRRTFSILGVIVISILLAGGLALGAIGALQDAPAGPQPGEQRPRSLADILASTGRNGLGWIGGTAEQRHASAVGLFEDLDRDRSGFIERDEEPAMARTADDPPHDWLAHHDPNKDDRVSLSEFLQDSVVILDMTTPPPGTQRN